ncbi:hypothetical protein GOC54_09855 [Sinorhizobium meliloti]|nr:hypothetical protein [Sinorhizobium meliloti]
MNLPSTRLLTKTQAASYCGLSVATFSGVCPVRPIAIGEGVRMHRYDVRDIDKWIDSFKAPVQSSLATTLLDKLSAPASLDDKYIKILRYMRDHPECDTAAEIRGAGEKTLDILCEKNVIRVDGAEGNGRRRFLLTKLGKDELKKIDAWELGFHR